MLKCIDEVEKHASNGRMHLAGMVAAGGGLLLVYTYE